MCFGFDGQGALERSAERRGIDRRTVLRGAVGAAVATGLAGSAVGAAGAAQAEAGNNRSRVQRVPRNRISIQLWTLRDAFGWPSETEAVQRDRYRATLREVAQIGYPRVELALGYFGHTPTQLRTFYRNIGVRPTSSHDGISDTDAALEQKLENAATIGQRYIVVPYLEAPLTLTPAQRRSQWQAWAERMNEEAEMARDYGLYYGYHNHSHEFVDDLGGGMVPWDVLTSRLDRRLVHFQIDLYWAITGLMLNGEAREATAETEVINLIRGLRQEVRQYHVKDRDPGEPANRTDGPQFFADPGTGMVDFGRIFDAHEVEEYIVENDAPDVSPLQTARVGYRYLSSLVWADEVRG